MLAVVRGLSQLVPGEYWATCCLPSFFFFFFFAHIALLLNLLHLLAAIHQKLYTLAEQLSDQG
jgi:hypothetical protein